MKNKILKKGLIVGILFLLILVSFPISSGNQDFNNILTLRANRIILPHIYLEFVWVVFEVSIWNEGPGFADNCNVTFNITTIFGKNIGGDHNETWIDGGGSANSGSTHYVFYECYGVRSVFNICTAKATIDVNDTKQSDNTDSFNFIIVNNIFGRNPFYKV